MIPVVLVPGLLCSADVFAPQVAALWPYGPVTVASTLEGDTITAMAAAILDAAPPRFALAGLSMGGFIAFEIMRQAPDRVLKLALIGTSARPDTPEEVMQRRALVDLARTSDFRSLLTEVFRTILHPSLQDDPVLRDITVRMGLTIGVEGMARQMEALVTRADSRPGLPAISVPTLVLVGDSDPLQPVDRSEEMATAIPGARLVVVPDCGHGSTVERPDAVNHALIEWITG